MYVHVSCVNVTLLCILDGNEVYETIPAREPSTAQDSPNLTEHSRSITSVSDVDDSIFTSTRLSSNLDRHPRAQIIREGFYQAPRSYQTETTMESYNTVPSRNRFNKSASSSNVPILLSSSTSMQHLPVTRYILIIQHSVTRSCFFIPTLRMLSDRLKHKPALADRTGGSLDDLLDRGDSVTVAKSFRPSNPPGMSFT